ncbi:hypothetical protein MK851_07950 [Tenacibaculum sp. 1B UA]|uniref:hypothetical protein n=1 Tax=unclassified Tenacibaculum TaxID=2635139 RepID=UPI0026E36FCA|nr:MULTISPECIES: hypothetical protein [unclassified Tenacibaculum]MDO6676790.1 hypothetical protein [Tenacibaculum sp. 1_MG-2023]MDX8553552.1 hypothetical protein [Tenacibaculum sp. 1B UA]
MKKYYLLLLCTFVVLATNAQDTNSSTHSITINFSEIAIVDLESGGSADITLDATAGVSEAGNPVNFGTVTNNSLWLNYTSILGNEANRSITAAITNGTVPAGISLNVTAAADAGNGDGTMGTSSGSVELSGTPQNFITGIGSAYTGNGISNGHNLTYVLGIADFSALDADNSGALIEVTYTITDTP